ncbi:MAG: hypothetical protein AB7F96_11520 [Beijerinckiaceae bacterium]
MSENTSDIQPVAPSLKGAMRRARIEEAERSEVVAELRGAELARLEMLAEYLEKIYAQVPEDVGLFDGGIAQGDRPRLFIDMIGFVEMGPDKRTYRFIQDTRHGRVILAESERRDTMAEAVSGYVARRLLERERALASDRTVEDAARALLAEKGRGEPLEKAGMPAGAGPLGLTGAVQATAATMPAEGETGSGKRGAARAPALNENVAAAPRRSAFAWLWDAIEFLALFVGFVVLLIALAGAVYFLWTMGEGMWIAKFFKAGSGAAPAP